jgi:hypothetical protein
MSRAGKGCDTLARNDQAVKIDATIVTQAKHVVISRRGRGEKLNLASYLSDLLKDAVQRDYDTEFGQGKRPKNDPK